MKTLAETIRKIIDDMSNINEAVVPFAPNRDGTISEEQYNLYKQIFDGGNTSIDYAFRNVMTGDEEQIRIIEEFENYLEDDDLDSWKDDWKPQLNDQEIKVLHTALTAEDPWNSQGWEDVFVEILKPHISNKDLFEQDYERWEMIFFAADYNEYVDNANEDNQE